MECWFSTVKFELGEAFESIRSAKVQLFDYIEVLHDARWLSLGGAIAIARSAVGRWFGSRPRSGHAGRRDQNCRKPSLTSW